MGAARALTARAHTMDRQAAARRFLRESLTAVGEPWASSRRYQLTFAAHVVAVPALVIGPTAWNYATLPLFQVEPARTGIWWVWIPTVTVLYLLSCAGAVLPAGPDGSPRHMVQRGMMIGIVLCDVLSNSVTCWLYGSLSTASAALFALLVAVYRVFLDYTQAAVMAAAASFAWVALAVCELNGWIPIHPLAPGLQHPAYTIPEVTRALIVGGPSGVLLLFAATNYGVNQAVLLHRYITDSVLRRYLPESLVRRAARGELELDGPPERRVVTVLFTDLVGFTSLSERLGAEAVGALLNRYLAGVSTTAHRHGATVDKFVGDGVMMVFGAPEALDPRLQAERAVALAREIHRSVGTLSEETPLQARTGINTGEVVVGNFGSQWRSDYTAIGPPVNLAARLESASQPGRILVGEETARLLGLEGTPVELELKGVSGRIRAWFVD